MNGTSRPQPRILSSWKEISRYTGHGVRTLQRYELRFGLPVHRLTSRGSVMAFVHEIDAWLNQAPMHQRVALEDGACPLCFGKGILSKQRTAPGKHSPHAPGETPTPTLVRNS
jgi:hypothetical protein